MQLPEKMFTLDLLRLTLKLEVNFLKENLASL